MKRRRFIDFLLGGGIAGTIITFLYPVLKYIWPPKQSEVIVKSVVAGKINELAPNTYKIFKFGSSPGILINTKEGELKAFTAVCTHLSCTVTYDGDTETIFCPCHNGRFDLKGNVISGPPPRPLEAYNVEIVGEKILVSKRT
ncbi:Rieske 2Fe-2S domain-containing protein [Candidatus Aminicenantes bacterium AC-335-A11]|jgi:Rieske Fe-S protein|nr:Rieske 2Fe-2S domain-containing protein [SCandidatus Aminicenantes bacterium Aminicenantia_JdfR_composite]MCP2618678.1 Rieske 2Fe-2S domain-containing protein [Candidatus Aminicenantes bacterium AC-335-A11]